MKPQFNIRDLLWLMLVTALCITITCQSITINCRNQSIADLNTNYSRLDKEYRSLWDRYVEMADVYRKDKAILMDQIKYLGLESELTPEQVMSHVD